MSEEEDVTTAAEANKMESPAGEAVPKTAEASSATEQIDSECYESRVEHETRVRHFSDPLFNRRLET